MCRPSRSSPVTATPPSDRCCPCTCCSPTQLARLTSSPAQPSPAQPRLLLCQPLPSSKLGACQQHHGAWGAHAQSLCRWQPMWPLQGPRCCLLRTMSCPPARAATPRLAWEEAVQVLPSLGLWVSGFRVCPRLSFQLQPAAHAKALLQAGAESPLVPCSAPAMCAVVRLRPVSSNPCAHVTAWPSTCNTVCRPWMDGLLELPAPRTVGQRARPAHHPPRKPARRTLCRTGRHHLHSFLV